jgi:TusA-related sulfurtransferase
MEEVMVEETGSKTAENHVDLIPMSMLIASSIQQNGVAKPLLVLFDSGTNSNWIRRGALPKGVNGKLVANKTGSTLAGNFESNLEVEFKEVMLPECYRTRAIDGFKAMVFNADCRYDMILGRDFLSIIGMMVDWKDHVMTWDEATVPMKIYPTRRPNATNQEPTVAEEMLLELMEADLEDDDEIFNSYVEEEDLSEHDIEPETAFLTEEEERKAVEEGYKSKVILPSHYKKVDVHDVVQTCTHLPLHHQNDLAHILEQYTTLFDGKLKVYKGQKIHLELKEGAVPYRTRAYPIPHSHLAVFKQELDRLVQIGVLERTGRQEWIAGSFIIPKKDASVRWISDFRGLNRALKRGVYPLPRIGDILKRRQNYKYVTKLDISMQYYTFELDEESSNLCTIATPFGLYRYKRLPMGVSCSPDISQEIMETVLQDIENVDVYLDDVTAFSNSWEEHLELLDKVLSRLQDAGFTINPAKCEWAVKETEFLGHWITPTGVKPVQKKVDAILKMEAPKNVKQLRSFLGLVTYYRDMWPQRSHILAPLTDMTGKKVFKWTDECEAAFKKMKALVAAETLLVYPDHNLPFDIETDASDYQLGSVIKQNDRPVAYYSRKLSGAQRNYSTIEKELLSIVETLKEFRTMLLGAQLRVYTDHKNLTHSLSAFATQRVLRWRILLEEYGCTYHYKTGSTNFMADALSRVPTLRTKRLNENETDRPLAEPMVHDKIENQKNCRRQSAESKTLACNIIKERRLLAESRTLALKNGRPKAESRTHAATNEPRARVAIKDEKKKGKDKTTTRQTFMKQKQNAYLCEITLDTFEKSDCMLFEQTELTECFLEYPKFDDQGRIPFRFPTLQHYQLADQQLQTDLQRGLYHLQRFGTTDLICQKDSNKIVLSNAILPRLVRWYHLSSVHMQGMNRLEGTIQQHFYHPRLRDEIRRQLSPCETCQLNKRYGQQFGALAPREAILIPWQEVHLDTIGPWKIRINKIDLEFKALTAIDPVTNLLEVAPMCKPYTGSEAFRVFENTWLSRYPRPVRCLHDNGPEFQAHEFQFSCLDAGLEPKPNTVANPQSNGIIESVHRSVGMVLRTLVHLYPPQTHADAQRLIERALATAMHATRCAAHSSLGRYTPGGLVFRRDMYLDIPLLADIITISEARQQIIDQRLLQANSKRIAHEFKVDEYVLRRQILGPRDKLRPTFSGPHRIVQVHTNGDVTLQINERIRERINIRRIQPFRRAPL